MPIFSKGMEKEERHGTPALIKLICIGSKMLSCSRIPNKTGM